ncbi:21 kDa protein [Pyrus ussuriensis x Pyrus communis]|uniref:21 kDa protein n=1 Tax=Pyrus ussuriensis x Pyrus communis TaxID=2448454 RepID=A0A5N5FML3_9ROSA|nr:21 kDa protein [Pyrus ussuriensis x Pyrus communis]
MKSFNKWQCIASDLSNIIDPSSSILYITIHKTTSKPIKANAFISECSTNPCLYIAHLPDQVLAQTPSTYALDPHVLYTQSLTALYSLGCTNPCLHIAHLPHQLLAQTPSTYALVPHVLYTQSLTALYSLRLICLTLVSFATKDAADRSRARLTVKAV